MAWVRKSDGTREAVPDEDVWGPEKSQAEIDAENEQRLQNQLDAMTDAGNDRDRALALLMADIWRAINIGMTQAEARAAVRSRLETHLRNIRG